MRSLLPAPSRRCRWFGVFVGCDRRAEPGAPFERFRFQGGVALAEGRRVGGELISRCFQIPEEVPEHHPPIISAASTPQQGKPSLDALKLLLDGPHGSPFP